MAQDQHFGSSSNSGGIGDAGGGGVNSNSNNNNNKSKNAKQKKTPQRGLGVAQLERLRLEEQRNRNREAVPAANALTNNAIGPAHDPTQCPNFGPNPIPAPVAPANSSFGPRNVSNLYRSVIGPSGPTGQITIDEMGLRGVSSWTRLWSGEYNNNNNLDGGGGEKQRVDHHHNVGFAFGPQVNLNLQYEPNGPVLPLPGGGPHRSFQFQFQRPPSSSVANVSSGLSPSSLSSSQTEPPSIQSVRGNNYTSSWSEDDKIAVGMKRAYPFNLESPLAPTSSFLGNFHASRSRSDEFPSCSNEPRNKYIRDGHPNSTLVPEQNPVEDVRLTRDFLTLAPPVAASTPLSSKNKHPLDYFGHQGLDLSDNRSLSSQENMRSSHAHRVGPSSPTEQPFSFFPIKPQEDQTSAHVRNGNEEKGDKLDLNLKL
ncbi:hypothetical protein PHJA_000106300 [Phtheirospermum japonicum]|uniref:Uncharacterized protein n=1 Tax=Phtheirospermum japonicum TaxID=374723 RepID=A0A830B3R9_9LAMI|nr:hypothetical protein PHJA_000106300 [Phtheirospermum japonicum]